MIPPAAGPLENGNAPRAHDPPQRHPMDPLIRFTLISLYFALVLPLPWLAPHQQQAPLLLAVGFGFVLVLALTSETVELDAEGIRVAHPLWCRWWLRRGWFLPWGRVKALIPVATSQGGRVFYIRAEPDRSGSAGEARLLPQRVADFEGFLERFGDQSGVSTADVIRVSPPWTYRLLAVLSMVMLAGEAGTLLQAGR